MSNINRESFKLTSEEGRSIIYEDNDDFEIIDDVIVDNGRWSIHHRLVVKRKADGKFFQSHYSVGATESQDQCAYDYEPAEFREVFAVTKTITAYE